VGLADPSGPVTRPRTTRVRLEEVHDSQRLVIALEAASAPTVTAAWGWRGRCWSRMAIGLGTMTAQSYGLAMFHSSNGKHVMIVQTGTSQPNGAGAQYYALLR
jgi:hypothetical protein